MNNLFLLVLVYCVSAVTCFNSVPAQNQQFLIKLGKSSKTFHPEGTLFMHNNTLRITPCRTLYEGNGVAATYSGDHFYGLAVSDGSLLEFSTQQNQQKIRRLGEVYQWKQCYADEETTRYLDIGIATDCSFLAHESYSVDSVLRSIESIVARANVVLSAQVNIRLRVKQVFVLPCSGGSSSIPFDTCQDNIATTLSLFSDWTSTLETDGNEKEGPVRQGLWHLLTACYAPPGNIGLAFLQETNDNSRFGTVCDRKLNVGVTSVKTGE